MNKSNAVIRTQGLTRRFRSSVKGEGMKGAFELLFNPKFKETTAVNNVGFEIEAGSFVGLIGANGAGKTTLLKMLAGLIPPSEGSCEVLGYKPFERPIAFRKSISLVMGQKAQLWWDLPAMDAFDLLQAIYEIPPAEFRRRRDELAELLDVTRHLQTQIRRLSLGERMKMELIGALIHWPKVVFLDEPTIGLDVLAAAKLREFLKTFNQKERATIILTSHNMDDIERLCSRVMIIREGQMIYDGSARGLTQKEQRRLRLRLTTAATIEDLARAAGLPQDAISMGPSTEDSAEEDEAAAADGALPTIRMNLRQDQITSVLQGIMAKYEVMDMGIEQQSLEQVIQRLYTEDRATRTLTAGPSAV